MAFINDLEEGVNSMLMKSAADTKLEGVTNNNEDRDLIQMDLKKLGESQWWQKEKKKVELMKIFIEKFQLEEQ